MRAAVIVLAWLTASAGAAWGELIFADGFESGDLSAWSSTVGSPVPSACVAGLVPADPLEGDLGPAPSGAFERLACLEVRNDQPFERRGEVAFSAVPMAAAAGVAEGDALVLVGPGGRRVAAQFDAVSRWGGPLADAARPIRWLGVSIVPRLPASGRAAYELRRYPSPPPTADPFAATIAASGGGFVVDTGLATFTLDPASPALLASIAIDDGVGRRTVYAHALGAGPRLVFDPGGGPVTLSTDDAGRVVVDPGGFEIVESGPVKVVVMQRGHFSAPGGASLCTARTPAYERFGFTAVLTFVRASRNVLFQLQVRNECSEGGDNQWMDDAVAVAEVSWELPFGGGLGAGMRAFHAGSSAVAAAPAGFSGRLAVEQRKGGGTPWRRRARVVHGGTAVESAETFPSPLVALSGDVATAAVQMPWMLYREPQALVADGATLAFAPVAETLVVGEGKAIWSFARLTLAPAAETAAAGSIEAFLEGVRQAGRAELERGLLVRAGLDDLNRSGVLAGLGSGAATPFETYYAATIDFLHRQTVEPGGQWDVAKTFGSQVWPDVQFDFYFPDWGEPAQNPVANNYWNPSGAELLELLRSGEPRWAWEFALPQSWLQAFTAHLNLGDRAHGSRNGLSVAGTGSGEGHWHRDGSLSSDDYNYNHGLQLAYALRPNAALRERFAAAGRTVVERYNVPHADEADRELYVNAVDLSRLAIQHFEHLANCAEFVPGARGESCHGRLMEILAELTRDNLSAGILCGEDLPAALPCSTPPQFMTNAHFYHFFHRMHSSYGDVEGLLRRALVGAPRAFYAWGIPKEADGTTVDLDRDWAGGLDCTLAADRRSVVSCAPWTGEDPTFWENRPHTVALMLMAQELDPSIGLCAVARRALDDLAAADALGGYVGEDVGWYKGSAQMMQGLVFAVGGYETCGDP